MSDTVKDIEQGTATGVSLVLANEKDIKPKKVEKSVKEFTPIPKPRPKNNLFQIMNMNRAARRRIGKLNGGVKIPGIHIPIKKDK